MVDPVKPEQLKALAQSSPELARLNPHLLNETHTQRSLSDAKPECHKASALGRSIQGEAKGDERVAVSFIGKRVRPLDPDNFAGSIKDLLDGLRHAGLIPGDEPWRIILKTEQVKVRSFKEEATIIEIEWP